MKFGRRKAKRRQLANGPHAPLAQVSWKLNNLRDSGKWTNLADGASLDREIDAAMNAPEPKDVYDCYEPIIEDGREVGDTAVCSKCGSRAIEEAVWD